MFFFSVSLPGIPPEDKVVITQTYKLLTDHVQPEDVLDRLQQGQVVKVHDRQEIMAPSKNSDRMQILLPKIIKSPVPYAFKLLCDALKFKNPKVYEQLMRTRKAVYKQGVSVTMDIAGITKEGLESHYKEVFSEFSPLPWSDEKCTIKEIFSQVELVHNDGKKAALASVFPLQTSCSRGPRVLIEGAPGSGKTTLASLLTYMWATAPQTFEHRYKLLLYLDAHAVSGSLDEEIYSQLLPPSIKVSQSEVWTLIEENPRDVLFLVDGFEGGQGGTQLTKVIQGSYLRPCAVVAFVRPEARVDGFVRPDLKLHLLGIKPASIASCLKGYARVLAPHFDEDSEPSRLGVVGEGAEAEQHRQSPGTAALQPMVDLPENYSMRERLSSPYVLTSTVAVSHILGRPALEEITTLTSLCEQLLLALATAYVQRLPPPEDTPTDQPEEESRPEGFPEEVTNAVGRLETLAFHTLTSRQLAFTEAELKELTDGDETLIQLGALHKSGPGQRYKFSCSLLRDFLAARFLADLDPMTLNENIESFALLRSPRTAYVVAFACGLYRGDRSSPTLLALFHQMALHNERRSKKAVGFRQGSAGAKNGGKMAAHNSKNVNSNSNQHLINSSITQNGLGDGRINGYIDDSNVSNKTINGPSVMNGNRGKHSSNKESGCDLSNINSLYVYAHSLLALAECHGREDLVTVLAPSFPRRLQVGGDNGLLIGGLVTGLSHMLKAGSGSGGVVSADVTLINLHERQRETWIELAQALGATETLRSITLNWTCADLMADFLHTCLNENPKNLGSVQVIDRTSGGSKVDHEASTWANIRGFCGKLEPYVREFSFLGSRAASVTCHVVQSIPATLRVLDLSGSAFNMMCAAQLGEAMEIATETATLKLAGVRLPGPAMAALVQGLKRCSCIQNLGLGGVTLDRSAVESLAEFIKLTSSLRVLDLSRSHLTTEMCSWLASSIAHARNLKRLVLHDTMLPVDGRQALETAAGELIVLEGLDVWSDMISVRTI
ncbi:nlr family card domain-containing protein 4-like [Plakobranchus ocellatus]|uniref:Nlr family card domain-containing protein 4-like n=1 Tax=Plakobranchus ocellatus TaxID=259542 RepID=A0AAV4D0W7_9GAST|nr:nlr family card domain-containing protein 4-like [Plakobranchus ocellatus]